MKPIKLTMSAFGPYGDVEVIDFDLFLDHSIFVITGKTGSGKTTIFDGICYALYGMASGADRDGESLRSHFNKGDRLTYVELDFLLRGQKYFIRRVPRQIRPVKIGEGFTEQKPEAELKMPSGNVITGFERVTEAITTLLGINYNQFRQIVMIPQGEFRELLLADSKNRETIFRKIFGTYQFQAIQDSLDKKSKDLKTNLNVLEQNQKIYIKSINPAEDENLKDMIDAENINVNGVAEALNEFINKDKLNEDISLKNIKKLGEELDKLNLDLTKGIEINNRFKEEEEAKKHRIALEQKIQTNREKEISLQKGRKALTIKATEDNCIQRYNSMKTKQKELEEAQKALDTASKNRIKTKKILLKEEEKEPYRQKLSESLTIFKRDKIKVIEYAKKISELNEAGKLIRLKNEDKNKSKNDIDALKKNEEKLQKDLEKSQKAALEYANTSAQLDKMQEVYIKMDKLNKEYQELKYIAKEYNDEKIKFDNIEKKYWEVKLKYEDMNELFLKGQAGLLAQELKEGKPCPVCGAIVHPKPASITIGTPTEDKLKKFKKEFTDKDEERKASLNKLTELKTKENTQTSSLEKLRKELLNNFPDMPLLNDKSIEDYIKGKIAIQKEEIKLLKNKTEELYKLKGLEVKIKSSINQIKEQLEKEEVAFEKIKQEYIELNAKINGLKDLIDKMARELPEGISTIDAMEKVIKSKEQELVAIEESRKNAEETFKNAEKLLTAAETAYIEKTKAYNLATEEYDYALKKLDKDILKSGFLNRDDYKASRMEEANIEALEREIKEYYGELKSAQDRHEKSIKAITGLNAIDTLDIENKIAEKKKQKEEEEKLNKKIYARLEKNKEVQINLIKIKKLISRQDEEYRKISHLAEMAKGNNSEKLSFERYVLAAYFDDIIKAANIRLKRMTDGRFELSRIQEKQKGKAQQGLDLEIYDYYTGQPRHVKVISGGESFKASLSLALGLSDVVQSSSGGISIDTMFIDEGFGTLDSESLEKSIECLLELQQSGKFVGVISHVLELKERIRARIEISSDITGSSANIIVN